MLFSITLSENLIHRLSKHRCERSFKLNNNNNRVGYNLMIVLYTIVCNMFANKSKTNSNERSKCREFIIYK